MSENGRQDGDLGAGARAGVSVVVLSVIGLALCVGLIYLRQGSEVDGSGCGAGGCDGILLLKWAALFGIPVSFYGALLYGGILAAQWKRQKRLRQILAGGALGAAAWFVVLQVAVMGSLCPWCMAAHAVAVALVCVCLWDSRRDGRLRSALLESGMAALWVFGGVGLTQALTPERASFSVTQENRSRGIEPGNSGRRVVFDGGRKSFDLTAVPLIGKTDAPHVLVEYFDYQCPTCRKLAAYLDSLMAKHPDSVAVIVLPVPLESSCNEFVPARGNHEGSCELSRLALEVWQRKPERFAEFHRFLHRQVSVEQAGREAQRITGGAVAGERPADSRTEPMIRANISDWRAISGDNSNLPKLMFHDRKILHGIPPDEGEFIRLMEHELGLTR